MYLHVVCQFNNDYVLIRLRVSLWMDLDNSFLPPRSKNANFSSPSSSHNIISNWIKSWSLLSLPHSLPLYPPLLPPLPRRVSNLSYYALTSFNHNLLTSCCNPKLLHRLTTPPWTEMLVLPMVLESTPVLSTSSIPSDTLMMHWELPPSLCCRDQPSTDVVSLWLHS